MNENFFERNDAEVTKLICKILLFMTFIFPAFFIFSITRLFSVTVPELLRLLPLGLICTLSPTILHFFHVKTSFLKNYCIIAVAFFITLMASNAHIGIYITYCLALALSCLYFNEKLTVRTAIIGYVLLVVAVYFRSGNVELAATTTRTKWFVAYTMGYTMEYVAMSLVFISLAGRARKLLESLHNTEQVCDILEHCGTASTKLSELMKVLKTSINDTVENNHRIENETNKTKDGCEQNLYQANETTASIQNIDSSIHQINLQTQALTEITTNSFDKTNNYIDIMKKAVKSMKQIEKSSNSIQTQIKAVEKCTDEISEFANTISSIAASTNILALNASIEAARAGEQGRGFAVVATQVGELAEATKEATINITERISQMNSSVEEASSSIVKNSSAVAIGINEIISAKEEATLILELQNESRSKVKDVENNIKISEGHQETVSSMAKNMSEITCQSLAQVKIIHTSLEEQALLTAHMQDVFDQVQMISDQLLVISQQNANLESN